MFGKTHIIIAISKEKVIAAKVKAKGKGKISNALEYGFDINTLDVVFENIKQKFKAKSVRILVGDSLSYVLRLRVPTDLDGDDERDFISKKIAEKIPEVLGNEEWDYKDLHFNVAKSERGEGAREKDVVVFSPVRGVFRALSQAVTKVGLKVEAIEPETISKTRDTNPLIGLAMKEDIKGKDQDVLNLEPIALSEASEEEKEDKDELLINKAATMRQEAEDEGKDDLKDVLADAKQSSKAKGQRSKLWIVVLIVMLLVGGGAFSLVYFSDSLGINIPSSIPFVSDLIKKDEQGEVDQVDQSETAETQEEEVTEESVIEESGEEEILDLSEYSMQVQNGSGTPGEADEVANTLLAEGFSGIETGNADSYEHAETEVLLKEGLSSKLYEEIERALNSDYLIASEAGVLENTSDYDIVVIVGERL